MKLYPTNHIIPPIQIERKNKIERFIDKHSLFFIYPVKRLYEKNLITDKFFLTLMYRFRLGKRINWKNPILFNEKLQWLKLYNRKNEYTNMVDKIKVKDFIKNKIGSQYVIPTLGVWDRPEEIDFDSLPSTFVLKCNHASSNNYIHSSPESPIDKTKIINLLNNRFNKRWDKSSGEWPYRNVKKKILAEQFISNLAFGGKPDYKILCFHGKPKFVQVFSWTKNYVHDKNINDSIEEYNIYYDLDWNKLDLIIGYPYNNEPNIPKPDHLDEMLNIAEKLSDGIPFIKIDLYYVDGKIYVGELTFFPFGGFGYILPNEEWDFKLGELINLNDLK